MNDATIWLWWYLTFLAIPLLMLGLLAKDPIMNLWRKTPNTRSRREPIGGCR